MATLAMVTLDCAELTPMLEFYRGALGWEVGYSDDNVAMLNGPGVRLGLGVIPDYRRPEWPNAGTKQYHLDLAVEDLEVATQRCLELGATKPAEQPGETWVVLQDPSGHPFCLTQAANWG